MLRLPKLTCNHSFLWQLALPFGRRHRLPSGMSAAIDQLMPQQQLYLCLQILIRSFQTKHKVMWLPKKPIYRPMAFSFAAGRREKSNASARPHCRQKCPPTGHIFALGCLSRLAEMSKKAAKYRIDLVACLCS